MDLSKLKILKKKIVKAVGNMTPENLKVAHKYFLNHFANQPEFSCEGESYPIKPKLLVAAKKAAGIEGQVAGACFRFIREYSFVHGVCTIEGRDATVIYCVDSECGLIIIDLPEEFRFLKLSLSCASVPDDECPGGGHRA